MSSWVVWAPPPIVSNPDELRSVLDEHKNNTASKLRVWCAHAVGVPNLAPIIVAAKAIPNNMKSSELYLLSREVIEGLLARGIKVISYSSDSSVSRPGYRHDPGLEPWAQDVP